MHKYCHSLLIRLMLRIIIPLKKKCIIIVSGRIDGMGAQVLAVYSAMVYAKAINIQYMHIRLKKVDHNDKKNPHYEKEIEEYFSLGSNETHIDNINIQEYNVIDLNSVKGILRYLVFNFLFKPDTQVVFQSEHFHNYSNWLPEKYNLIKEELRNKFFATPKNYPLHKSGVALSLAIHIRRGDVSKDYKDRYTSNSEIRIKLNALIKILNNNSIPFIIHVYSEGEEKDFIELSDIAVLHLNDDVFETFYNLVEADILFMAKSAFSFIAALLSKGLIIYDPFWHKPMKQWFIYQNGVFSKNKFQTALKEILKNHINV